MWLERLGRGWRVVATAFCFAVFGLGGLLIRVVVYPLLVLLVRRPEARSRLAKAVIHHSFRLFVALMAGVGVLSYEVRGLDKLRRRGLLVLANHPSLIDVVFLIALIARADCVVKAALLRNPFTRGPIAAAGFVCNDEGPGLVADCIASVRSGNNLIIFPEGTRTPATGAPRLQRGAANIAVHGRLDVTPVRIRCSPPVLGKGVEWYGVPRRRPHFVIEVCDDIAVAGFLADEPREAIAARRLTGYLGEFLFGEEQQRAES